MIRQVVNTIREGNVTKRTAKRAAKLLRAVKTTDTARYETAWQAVQAAVNGTEYQPRNLLDAANLIEEFNL